MFDLLFLCVHVTITETFDPSFFGITSMILKEGIKAQWVDISSNINCLVDPCLRRIVTMATTSPSEAIYKSLETLTDGGFDCECLVIGVCPVGQLSV